MNHDERFAQNWRETVFMVEATGFERHALWLDWADDFTAQNYGRPWKSRVSWNQESLGSCETIGTVKELRVRRRPICVSVTWAIILGKRVAFYEATSQIVDYVVVEKWVESKRVPRWDRGTRAAQCDAMNFHHCLDALREAAKR